MNIPVGNSTEKLCQLISIKERHLNLKCSALSDVKNTFQKNDYSSVISNGLSPILINYYAMQGARVVPMKGLNGDCIGQANVCEGQKSMNS